MDDPRNTRLEYVKITNNLDVPFTDRYDGVPVTIEPGRTTNLPLDVARHILGFEHGVDEETMFRHVSKRQGWNTVEFTKPAPANERKMLCRWMFERLKIEPVVYKLVEDKPDPMKPVPALQDEPRRPGRPTNAEIAARKEAQA